MIQSIIDMPSIKSVQATSWLSILLIEFFFVMITLFSSLFKSIYTNPNLPFWVWIIIPMFLILVIEATLSWVTASLNLDEEKLRSLEKKNIFSKTASNIAISLRYTSLASSISLLISALILITIFLYYFLRKFISEPINFSSEFYIQLITYLAYFLILRRPLSWLGKAIIKSANKMLPYYTLQEDGILLNLNMRDITNLRNPNKYIVKINFDELDEIRVLSYIEAQSFQQLQMGPDITLVMQSVRDTYNYLRKKIPRPNKYVLMSEGSSGKTLLLRGPEIFYLIAIANENTDDLLNAFRTYKEKNSS